MTRSVLDTGWIELDDAIKRKNGYNVRPVGGLLAGKTTPSSAGPFHRHSQFSADFFSHDLGTRLFLILSTPTALIERARHRREISVRASFRDATLINRPSTTGTDDVLTHQRNVPVSIPPRVRVDLQCVCRCEGRIGRGFDCSRDLCVSDRQSAIFHAAEDIVHQGEGSRHRHVVSERPGWYPPGNNDVTSVLAARESRMALPYSARFNGVRFVRDSVGCGTALSVDVSDT